MARGRFITFEGVDGCGKSTQLRRFVDWLCEQGAEVVLVREPGGTALGERVRELLLDPGTGEIAPQTEALLYASARAELVATVVAPALERGSIVVADRFLESSLAYQGGGRQLGFDAVRAINTVATGGLRPDAVVMLEVDPHVAAARRDGVADRIELEGDDFFARVREAYLELARSDDPSYLLVDGSGSVDEVHERVLAAIGTRCPDLTEGVTA